MASPRNRRNRHRPIVISLVAATLLTAAALGAATSGQVSEDTPDQVLEWNQIFIDTLIATNTPNAASQRLGAIVHTAIFDAYNGIEQRYTPVLVHGAAPSGASRRQPWLPRHTAPLCGCSRRGNRNSGRRTTLHSRP